MAVWHLRETAFLIFRLSVFDVFNTSAQTTASSTLISLYISRILHFYKQELKALLRLYMKCESKKVLWCVHDSEDTISLVRLLCSSYRWLHSKLLIEFGTFSFPHAHTCRHTFICAYRPVIINSPLIMHDCHFLLHFPTFLSQMSLCVFSHTHTQAVECVTCWGFPREQLLFLRTQLKTSCWKFIK